jgi:hypothetical protein
LNAYIGWKNAVLTGALTASSQESTLPVTNLQNQQGAAALAWQTTGCTQESLTIDSGSTATKWQAFGLFRTNLSPSATVEWLVSNNADMSAPRYDSGAVSGTVAAGYGQSVLVPATLIVQNGVMAGSPFSVTGRYAQCTIRDPSNTDGFLNIPLAFAGPVFSPQTNFDFSGGQGRTAGTTETTTRGGQEFPLTTWVQRTADVSFMGLRGSEAWADIMDLDLACRSNQNVLWIPTPAGENQAMESVFGRLKPNGSMTWPFQSADRRAYKFQITERL